MNQLRITLKLPPEGSEAIHSSQTLAGQIDRRTSALLFLSQQAKRSVMSDGPPRNVTSERTASVPVVTAKVFHTRRKLALRLEGSRVGFIEKFATND